MTSPLSPDRRPVPGSAVPLARRSIMEPLVILAFLAVWLILQIWVLPKLGVRT